VAATLRSPPGANGRRSPSVSPPPPPPDARPPWGRRRRAEEDAAAESGAEVGLPLEQHAVVDAELTCGQLDVEATQLLEGAERLVMPPSRRTSAR
jgi:hypothetical protein